MEFEEKLEIVLPQQAFGWEGGNQYLRSVRRAAVELQNSGELNILPTPKQPKIFSSRSLILVESIATKILRINSGLNFPWPLNVFEIRSMFWIPDCQDIELPEMFTARERISRERGRSKAIKRNRAIFFSSQNALQVFVKNYGETKNIAGVVRFTTTPIEHNVQGNTNFDFQCDACKIHGFFYLPNQWWKHKNHLFAIEEFLEYRNTGGKKHLILTGEARDYRWPDYISDLMSLVQRHDSIHSLGLIERSAQQELYRRCTTVLQPSLYEGWSTTIEEALYFGAPIIATDLPVIREQVAGVEEVVLIDVAKKGQLCAALMLPPVRNPQLDLRVRYELRWERFKMDLLETLKSGLELTS